MKRLEPASSVSRVLVITLSNIGDVILTTPVLSLLRERFQSAHLTVVVGPKGAPLFERCKTVDDIVVFDKHGTLPAQIKFLARLRKHKYDLVVDLRNTLIPWLVRARYRSPLCVKQADGPMRARHLSRLDFLLPVPDYEENKFDFFSGGEKDAAFRAAGKTASRFEANGLIVIAPGAGGDLKRWTISGFQAVVRYFLAAGRSVVLVGGGRETALAREIEEAAGSSPALANLAGCLTLRETAALISDAALVVANDSAVMHFAHELGRPTVSIFGPTDETQYGRKGSKFRTVRVPLDCAPCRKAQCGRSYRACLDDLAPQMVIAVCEELLNV